MSSWVFKVYFQNYLWYIYLFIYDICKYWHVRCTLWVVFFMVITQSPFEIPSICTTCEPWLFSRLITGCRLDDRGLILGGVKEFPPCQHVQTGSGFHPTLCHIGAKGSFLWSKTAGAWSWPHVYLLPGGRIVELYFHIPTRLHDVVRN
jgi:hypothetical protein